jgi:CHASE2 domain-containing sensor protein
MRRDGRSLRFRAGVAILAAALVSLILSAVLWFSGDRQEALFVGLWVPSILGFGSVALLLSGGRDA